MIRSIGWNRGLAALAALAVAGLAAGPARAQVEPFKVTGGGPVPHGVSLAGGYDSPHSATGNATHIGTYTGDGVFNSLSFNPVTGAGTFQGTFTFVAKNGDKLAMTYGDTSNGADVPGVYQAHFTDDGQIYVVFVAEFNPIPSQCTGRFANVVDGRFIMTAVSSPFEFAVDADGFTPKFTYTWKGDGWLKFKRGK